MQRQNGKNPPQFLFRSCALGNSHISLRNSSASGNVGQFFKMTLNMYLLREKRHVRGFNISLIDKYISHIYCENRPLIFVDMDHNQGKNQNMVLSPTPITSSPYNTYFLQERENRTGWWANTKCLLFIVYMITGMNLSQWCYILLNITINN